MWFWGGEGKRCASFNDKESRHSLDWLWRRYKCASPHWVTGKPVHGEAVTTCSGYSHGVVVSDVEGGGCQARMIVLRSSHLD